MKGPEFVKVLKNIGFDKVKTHMAVIDDADQMVLEVRLGAAGYQKAESQAATSSSPIKKKSPIRKKKAIRKKGESDESTSTAIADEPASPIRRKSPIRKKESAEAVAETPPSEVADAPSAPAEETAAETTSDTDSSAAAEPAAATAAEDTSESVEAPSEAAVSDVADSTAADSGAADSAAADSAAADSAAADSATADSATADSVAAERQADTAGEQVATPAAEVAEEPAESVVQREPQRTEPAPEIPEAPAAAQPELTRELPAASSEAPAPGDAPSEEAAAEGEDDKSIRRLPPPEPRAKILGRIELPRETITDATRRSAPSGPRNPGSVDRNLRKAAMQSYRNRGAQQSPFARRGPGGPGRGPGGRRGGGGGGSRRGRDPLAPPPGIDPDKLVQVVTPVSVKKLSEALGHGVNQMLLVLMRLGVAANINSYLDKEQIELLALELKRNVEVVEETGAEEELISQLKDAREALVEEDLETRPPIVTFMGHVDHGKTTLIDALRGSDITKGEAGGITQHVGAYRVKRGDNEIVIMDTPGHAAFTAMRARGAQLTDLVVLVVAADDGVMPQTEEALNHAKAAEVPLVIAVNKCDRPDANPMRARQQLSALGVQPEEWGGNVQFVDVSAINGDGLDTLVETLCLEAEILELKASSDHEASGKVIEAKQTPAQGNVISVMVLDGTIRKGNLVLCGSGTGRVRVLINDRGEQVEEAGPGTPVEILGLPELPSPGDDFFVVKNQKVAKEVATQRAAKQRTKALAEKSKSRMLDLKSQLAAAKREEVKIILKADVMGSLEPIRTSLEELSNDEVGIRILHAALGGITETDVSLAEASAALIVGFNSVPDDKARAKADEAGVQIKFYNIIYELLDDAKKLLEGLLSPEEKEEIRGHAEIRVVFRSSKFGNIAGCYVTDGVIGRNHKARLVRDGVVVYSGRIGSLRRGNDDAREARENFECGILLHNFDDIKEGDIIEAYEIIELKRSLGD